MSYPLDKRYGVVHSYGCQQDASQGESMNTTAAATEANVTVATIRAWCRNSVITATKTAGRWIIDTASLAHRIAIGALKTRKPRPVIYSIETMTAIGGREWIRGDKHRVYLNNWHDFAGLDIARYRSGNVSSAALAGRAIANNRVGGILSAIDKVYFDATDGQLHAQHYGAREYAIRYLNGDRDTIDLVDMVFTGIRTAIAAL